MTQRKTTFWRWRLAHSKVNLPIQIAGIVIFCFASTFFIRRFGAQKGQFAMLVPLLANPLFILAVLMLVASQIDLDYMEYKVQQKRMGQPSASVINRHKTVPRLYESLFGSDIFLRAWRWRFVYIVSAALALVDWIYSIK